MSGVMPSLMCRGLMTPEEARAFSGVFHAHKLDGLPVAGLGKSFQEVADRCDPLTDFIIADRGDETYLVLWGSWCAARKDPKWRIPVCACYGARGAARSCMECTIITPYGPEKIYAEAVGATYDDLKAEIVRKVAAVYRPVLWRLEFPRDYADLPPCALEVKASKSLVANGSGLAVNVTKEARLLGLRRGDAVEITMRRL